MGVYFHLLWALDLSTYQMKIDFDQSHHWIILGQTNIFKTLPNDFSNNHKRASIFTENQLRMNTNVH